MGSIVFILIPLLIVAETVEQLLYRAASGKTGRQRYLTFYAPAIALHLLRLAAWLAVLRTVKLSVALPLTAMTFATIALGGRVVFGERVDRRRWTGIALVGAGFVLISTFGR